MVRINTAIEDTNEVREGKGKLNELNYRHLLERADNPTENELNAYERYIDSVIGKASKEGEYLSYFRTYSSNNFVDLLGEFHSYKTSRMTFSEFCNAVDEAMYKKVVERYKEEGYSINKHSEVDYRIGWR